MRTASLLVQLFPQLVDLWLVGAPNNYQHTYPEQNYDTIQHGYEFNNFITFGDSLSDQGSNGRYSMYLAGGYDKSIYVDYLSLVYTGKISKPYSAQGLNYAQRGATMDAVRGNDNLIEQVNLYLQNNNGKADSNSLYMLWGGAMDVNTYIGTNIIDIISGRYDLNAREFSFGNGPKVTAYLAQELTNRGASYVFVPNIPDSSLIPYSMMIVSEQLIENTLGRLNIPYTWLIGNIGKRVDSYLRNPDNWVQAEGENFVRLNHIQAMQTQILWYLPPSLVVNLYDWMAKVQKRVTSQYNYSLNQALGEVNGNVVYFDFAEFMQEVINNYQRYDIDNVLVPTCTLGYSSRYCDISSPNFHEGKYLFGDWFHPSGETHRAIGQYIQSIFDAPVYASSIARQLENINLSRDFFIQQQLMLKPQYNHEVSDSFDLLLSYSGGLSKDGVYTDNKSYNTNLLNIGIKKTFANLLQIGGLLSFSSGVNRPHDLFSYHFNYQNISFFAQYFWSNQIWSSINLGFSRVEAKNINRSIPMFETTLHTTAKTRAYSYGSLLKTGWNFVNDDDQQSAILMQLGLNYIKVKGYEESGIDAISMRYSNYHYHKNYLGLGWQYQNQQFKIKEKPVHLSFQLSINRQIGKKNFEVPASIKTAPVKFNRKIQDQNKLWFNTQADASIHLNKKINLSSQVGYSSDLKRKKNLNYSLGFQYNI
ncbi:hypothetical protein GKC56_00425 [Neisseriaceae bacterium PsAf]|nr:hypothetical protein [Neisseriaceae bacterium PsAf]